jgi:hypothetical protein
MTTSDRQKRQMVTVAQWGASVGITRQAAYRAIKRCGIPVEGGAVDVEAATALYRSRTRAKTSGASTPKTDATPETPDAGSPDYWQARARREQAEAGLAEDKLRTQRGELVERADLERVLGRWLVLARERMLILGARLGPVVAPLDDPGECSLVVDAEARAALDDLIAAAELRGL